MSSERAVARFVEDVGFLLSNLSSENSGVQGAILWFAAGEYSRTEAQHGAKLLVVPGESLTAAGLEQAVSVTLSARPRVLGTLPDQVATQVVEFINRNRGALLQHWNCEIDTMDVLEQLERI